MRRTSPSPISSLPLDINYNNKYSHDNDDDDKDLVLLSNAVSASLSLKVVLWVPVAVKDDDGVSGGKVHTETSSTCRQQETEILRRHTPINTPHSAHRTRTQRLHHSWRTKLQDYNSPSLRLDRKYHVHRLHKLLQIITELDDYCRQQHMQRVKDMHRLARLETARCVNVPESLQHWSDPSPAYASLHV